MKTYLEYTRLALVIPASMTQAMFKSVRDITLVLAVIAAIFEVFASTIRPEEGAGNLRTSTRVIEAPADVFFVVPLFESSFAEWLALRPIVAAIVIAELVEFAGTDDAMSTSVACFGAIGGGQRFGLGRGVRLGIRLGVAPFAMIAVTIRIRRLVRGFLAKLGVVAFEDTVTVAEVVILAGTADARAARAFVHSETSRLRYGPSGLSAAKPIG